LVSRKPVLIETCVDQSTADEIYQNRDPDKMIKVILLIDDSQELLDNIHEFCELEGWNCLSATTGRTGIELAQIYRPDLVLCDVKMIDNGFRVWDALKNLSIPFIFVTACLDPKTLKRINELGVSYIAKPFDLETLNNAICSMLT
jgi:DNA-binding response OmpR family regulator